MIDVPRMSVVIVNWNTQELLRACLSSLMSDHRHGICEIVVVDNGSIDGSVEMVTEEFRSVRLIANSENRGFAAATNQGFDTARGDYVLLLNSDTEVGPTALRDSMAFLDTNRDVGVLGCRIVYPDGSAQNSYFRFPSVRAVCLQAFFLQQIFKHSRLLNWGRYGLEQFTEPRDVDCVIGGFMMLRACAISERPLLDEGYFMYAEEADLCYRLKSRRWRVVFHPGTSVAHHHQASSGRNPSTAAWAYEAKQRGHLRFIRKWRGFSAAYVANLIMLMGLVPRVVGWLLADLIAAARARRPFRLRSALKTRSLCFHFAAVFQPSRFYSSWAPVALDPSTVPTSSITTSSRSQPGGPRSWLDLLRVPQDRGPEHNNPSES